MEEQESLVNSRLQTDYGDIISSTTRVNETASALQEVNVILTLKSIAFTAVISLLLGLLTNITGIFYITRYESMKILSERG